MTATPYDSFDLESLRLAPAKQSKAAAGCKTAKIQGPGGRDVLIQTPPMTIPWDIVARKMDENSSVSANLSLSFVGMDENDADDDLKKFMDFMKNFDAKIKALIGQTGGALGKQSEEKVLAASFKESIKYSSNGDYPPTIQPKIWVNLVDGGDSKCVDDHTLDVTVFNFDGKELCPKQLRKGCVAAAIIKFAYVWCSALGCGITYVAEQVAVKPIEEEKFAFKLGPKFDHLKTEEEHEEPAAKKAKTEEVLTQVASDHLDSDSQGSSGNSEEQVDF